MRFDSNAVEQRALRLMRSRREAGESYRALAEACEVSEAWLRQWDIGQYSDPGIHRIGRVLERLG